MRIALKLLLTLLMFSSQSQAEEIFSSYSTMYQCLRGLVAGNAVPRAGTPHASRSDDVFGILDGSDFYLFSPEMMYTAPFEYRDTDTEVIDGRPQIVDVTRTRTYNSAGRCSEGIVNGSQIHRFRFIGARGMDPRPGPWDFRFKSNPNSRGKDNFQPYGVTNQIGPSSSGDGFCVATLRESMGSEVVDNSVLALILNGFVQRNYPSEAIERAERRRQAWVSAVKERNEDMQLLQEGNNILQEAGDQIRSTLESCTATGNEAIAGYANTALTILNQDPRFRTGSGTTESGTTGDTDEGQN